MRLIIYAILFIVIFISVDGFAQGCDDHIMVKSKSLGSLGYQPRTPKSRCEGLYYDNASGVAIDLVSFTRGKIRYQLRPEEVIDIHFKPDKKFGTIWIRGTSFKSSPKYRLDMPLDDKKHIARVPVNEVLNKSRISSTNIGFYGYVVNNNTMLYFPVSTTSKFYSSPQPEEILLTVLSNVETDLVVYKYADAINGVCGKFSSEIKLQGGFEKLEPIEIAFKPVSVSKEICLEISVRAAGTTNSWTSEQFAIYLPAR